MFLRQADPVLAQGFEFFDGKQIEDHAFHDYEPLIQAWVKHQFWPALRNKVIDMDAIPTRNVGLFLKSEPHYVVQAGKTRVQIFTTKGQQ